MDLFEAATPKESLRRPLAERLRPRILSDFVGQQKALDPRRPLLKNFIENKILPNLLLWGPPGTGKTTFANVIAEHMDARFISVNAVDTGAKKLREIGQEAHSFKIQYQRETILFVDEIHRLNKAQQDVLLPFAEKGDFVLIGATTENPGYEINAALLSRMQTLVFERLQPEDLTQILVRACEQESYVASDIFDGSAQENLIQMADGDARQLLNLLEQIFSHFSLEKPTQKITKDQLSDLISASPFYYDKSGDEHYNCVSAMIKSIRGSDPDAGLYYLARMLESGEDPVFIARRLVILASEDVGNADPRALTLAVSGLDAVKLIGLPECAINLAQVVTYLACAPKSNRSYKGLKKAQQTVREKGRLEIPISLRSAQTKFAKSQGFGEGYKYSHDGVTGFLNQDFLPEKIQGAKFYEPTTRGFEKNIIEYQKWVRGESIPNPDDNS